MLSLWALNSPDRKSSHYVFPRECVGMSGHRFQTGSPVYTTTPTKPMGSNKTDWKKPRRSRVGFWREGRRTAIAAHRWSAVSTIYATLRVAGCKLPGFP